MKQELHLPGEGAQMWACWDLPSGRCTQPASGRRAATKPALRLAYYPGSLGGFLSACFLRTASKMCPSWWACEQSERLSPWLWPQAHRHEWLGWAGGLFLQQESRSVSRAEGKNTGARKNVASVGEGATRACPCPPHLWPCHLRPHCPASPLLPQAPERSGAWDGGIEQVSQFSKHCRNNELPLHLLPSRRAAAAHPPPHPLLRRVTRGNTMASKRTARVPRSVFSLFILRREFLAPLFYKGRAYSTFPDSESASVPPTCKAKWWRVRKLHPVEGSGGLATGARLDVQKQTRFLPPRSRLGQQVNNPCKPALGASWASPAPCLVFPACGLQEGGTCFSPTRSVLSLRYRNAIFFIKAEYVAGLSP